LSAERSFNQSIRAALQRTAASSAELPFPLNAANERFEPKADFAGWLSNPGEKRETAKKPGRLRHAKSAA